MQEASPSGTGGSQGYRWAVLLVATLSQATAAFVTQGLPVLAAFMQAALRLDGFQVGLLIAALNCAPIFALVVIGALLDRRSERAIILLGSITMALGLIAAAFFDRFLLLLLALGVVGLGYSTVQPGGSRSVSLWFADSQRGLAMGLRQAGLPLGGALAALLVPLVVAHSGWRAALLVCAAVALFGGVLFALLYRKPWRRGGPTSERPEQLPRMSRPVPPLGELLPFRDIRLLFGCGWMRRLISSGAVLVGTQYAVVVNLMLFLRDQHGMSLERGALFLGVLQLSGAAGRIGLSVWTDRYARTDRVRAVRISMLASAAGLVWLLLAPLDTPPFAWALAAGWLGFFALGWYGPWVTALASRSDPAHLGLSLGLAMTTNQVAIVLVPPLLGALFDLTGSYAPVWAAMILWLMAAWLHGRRRDAP